VYNRALSNDERYVVEQYLAARHVLGGPHALAASTLYSLTPASPLSYVTFGSRVLNGTISASTLLRYAVNVRKSPLSFGMPLYALLLEEDASPVPHPSTCNVSTTCGGRRFYSVCYNGGMLSANMFCDQTIDSACRRRSRCHARWCCAGSGLRARCGCVV
jgi:hypothetical protein